MNLNPDDDGIILYAGHFFETRLPLAAAATLAALAGAPLRTTLPLLPGDELAGTALLPASSHAPPAAVVFPTRRSG